MKKFFQISFAFIFLLGILHILNGQFHFVGLKNSKEAALEFAAQKRLQTFHPILEDKQIVALVLAEDCSKSAKRCLDSILGQTYSHFRVIVVDNGSTDGTAQTVACYLEEREKNERVQLIHHEKKQPEMQVYYEVIQELDPRDIVVLIEGNNWLAHENVFDHLNCAYANPDVWMTYSRIVSHPNYQDVLGHAYPDCFFNEKKLRKQPGSYLPGLKTFYASFFHAIKLQDFLFDGRFIEEEGEKALVLPMVEMGPSHILFLDEIAYVKNESDLPSKHKSHLRELMAIDAYLRSLPAYPTLNALQQSKPSTFHHYEGDVIIFSEDSPLELYACLESLHLKVRDVNAISVIYKCSDTEFERAYLNLKNEFPKVQFLDVCEYPGNDFDSLLKKTLANQRYSSPYLLLMDDHVVFDEKLRLHECIQAMEKIHSNHFFLCLDGTFKEKEPLPTALSIEEGVYAWQIGKSWECPQFCTNLCRKQLFTDQLEEKISDLAAFKKLWKEQISPHFVGLFFEEKKMLLLQGTEAITASQKKEWGHKFIEGFKIDLPSLACEIEDVGNKDYPLIKRERKARCQL